MNGERLKALRAELGWTHKQLAQTLSEALGRNVTADTTTRWQGGSKAIPADVDAFLESLAGMYDDGAAPLPPPRSLRSEAEGDSSPAADGPLAQPALLYTGSSYAKVCEQFFELIATGVGMIGAAVGSPALRADGLIIDADKQNLGAAYGKLAESNEVFRNMILATDRQGAYLAVALATGVTVGKIWRSHVALAEAEAGQAVVDAVEALRVVREQDVDAAG